VRSAATARNVVSATPSAATGRAFMRMRSSARYLKSVRPLTRRLLWRWPPSRNELQQVVAVVLVEAGPKTLL